MSDSGARRSEPGERPPSGAPGNRLERPPSERYRTAERSGAAEPIAAGQTLNGRPGRPSARGPIAAAIAVAVAGAAGLTVILGVVLATTGTFAVSLLGGAAIGLIVAGAAVGSEPTLAREAAIRIAIALALGMVVLAGLATWLLARAEGGVLDPLTYLWTTFGLGIPAQAVVAVIAAAWGAASGPIRWR